MADIRRAEKPERPIGIIPWSCRICEAEIGVSTTATMKVRQGGFVRLTNGRMVGGTMLEVCAACLGRGRTTIVARG